MNCISLTLFCYHSVEMASEVADLQLEMKQATKEQELLQSQVDTDSKVEELQGQLQELHKK